MENYLEINKALWNKKTPVHLESAFYNMKAFRAGASSLTGPEVKYLKDIKGLKILHLQCHFGQDSLSLARLGAQVTGLDLSDEAISTAQKLSKDLGIPAEFICTDVYNTPDKLNGLFDMVYTSYGTIGWLPDLNKWAAVIARVLKPGGRLVFAEFHPVVWMYDANFREIEYSYFNKQAIVEVQSGTYAEPSADLNEREVSWNHSLAEVFTALIDQGIQIKAFEEFDCSPVACFPNSKEVGPHQYAIDGLDRKIPMMYTLLAQKLN